MHEQIRGKGKHILKLFLFLSDTIFVHYYNVQYDNSVRIHYILIKSGYLAFPQTLDNLIQ